MMETRLAELERAAPAFRAKSIDPEVQRHATLREELQRCTERVGASLAQVETATREHDDLQRMRERESTLLDNATAAAARTSEEMIAEEGRVDHLVAGLQDLVAQITRAARKVREGTPLPPRAVSRQRGLSTKGVATA